MQKVTFSNQNSPQKSPHFASSAPVDYFIDSFSPAGLSVNAEASTTPKVLLEAVVSDGSAIQFAVQCSSSAVGMPSPLDRTTASLPVPMSGVSELDTTRDVPLPSAIKSIKLPLPEVRFRSESNEVDLSSTVQKPGKRQHNFRANLSVGDSIDLSGLTAQVSTLFFIQFALFLVLNFLLCSRSALVT